MEWRRFYGVSAAVIFSILFIFTSCLYADDLTINGSKQMAVNASQTLTASGCGDPNNYKWTIAGGGGSFTGNTRTATGASGEKRGRLF
jgi:hypothetical protein